MDQDHNAAPLNPLPPIVWLMVLPMLAMELVLSLADRGIIGGPQAIGWRIQAVERFAFFPELMRYMVETGTYSPDGLIRLISYPLIHGTFTHALFAIVMVLALGKMVGEIFRWWAVLVVVLGAAIAGALAYGFLVPGLRAQLMGAYPSVYGLIGAFTFLLWVRLAGTGTTRYRAFSLIGMLLLVQLLFGVLFGSSWDWVADIAGFAAGFLLSFVVSPGGFGRVVAMIRQR
ncbi:rhomboid family intramembrane serine protease [Tabrizicola sp.]|uniref:rhomboid family intramembrane serine protease n=1 Tax=Tabrizicola sp. TaxID=2005166 RepID=UPI00286BAD21|nr:rhomboid family intramembrane serine protease [Tabrizicola sp.]